MKSKNRINIIDEARGLFIILVVIYHFFYSASMIYKFPWATNVLPIMKQIQPVLPIMFVLISGISFNLSKSNIKRGIFLFAIAIGITVVTATIIPSETIWFGVIHLIGFSNIFCGLIKKQIHKIPWVLGAVIFAVLFMFTYNISLGYIGFMPEFAIRLPRVLYSTNLTAPLGFYTSTFQSADYNGIIPWMFLFISGICLGKHVKKLPHFLSRKHIPPLAFLGRHTLIIYIAHQPIILGVLYLVSLIR